MQPKIENARRNLMSHGKKALLKSGYSGIVIAELTAECGMAAGTFYNYFKSKDDLVNQIISGDWAALLKKVKKQMAQPENRCENLRCLYDCLAEFQHKYCFLSTGSVIKNEAILRSERSNLQQLYELMADKIRRETEQSNLSFGTTPENAAYLLVQLCMVAGRCPTAEFEDLWNFLHVSNPSFTR